ncbi:hypothetical protein P872_23720 [Rhodonellum psychrophilum GCM71 = DSM 17998]|uniref:Uncharacterized protein n=1 Tax=Rhodonellum psychrophilum GCM71 = DSM 17998 TaxID=1123057 RepID=U5C935_9BACT|nr:hypothetical protein P872_23720 [Rhodonellum psychrophilum GCM71 = DSM 17998]
MIFCSQKNADKSKIKFSIESKDDSCINRIIPFRNRFIFNKSENFLK